jgi:hypothetical protein
MLDVWRGTMSPRTLLNLIEHLPRTSAYQQALANDDEVAAAAMADEPSSRNDLPLSEFSPEVEALASVVDRLGEVTAVLINANGGKAKPPKPYPRPVTAWDRVRARRHQDAYEGLKAVLFPDDPA